MSLDQQLYRLPLIGRSIERLYSYFKEHTAFTDLIHVAIGLGLGLIIAGGDLLNLGFFAIAVGILGHTYAYIKGSKK